MDNYIYNMLKQFRIILVAGAPRGPLYGAHPFTTPGTQIVTVLIAELAQGKSKPRPARAELERR